MSIEGYTISTKWGSVVNSEGRGVADSGGGYADLDEYKKLQQVAFKYFYKALLADAGLPENFDWREHNNIKPLDMTNFQIGVDTGDEYFIFESFEKLMEWEKENGSK